MIRRSWKNAAAAAALGTALVVTLSGCGTAPWAAGETSAQSMSSSGGPAKTMVRRIASTPNSSMTSPRLTPPLLFDIFEPPERTMPWLSRALNGSVNET